jgi:hypothetical protein
MLRTQANFRTVARAQLIAPRLRHDSLTIERNQWNGAGDEGLVNAMGRQFRKTGAFCYAS